MMTRYAPLLLGLLAATLIGLSVMRWMDGSGLDWFSLLIAVAALGLLALQLRQDGSD